MIEPTIAPQIDSAQYAAMTDVSAYQRRNDSGVLRVTGEDRVDFLQRMTSNNIAILAPNQSTVTVLTSPTARIVQVFTVLCRADDLLLLPANGETDALARHLRRQIFFMDKVEIEDLSDDLTRLRLAGAQAAQSVSSLISDGEALANEHFVEQDGLILLAQFGYDVPGYELIVPSDQVDAIRHSLEENNSVAIDDMVWTARRVELGRPAPGAELTETYTPLEAGLAWACAENKGCYTGQEIIARQITYDKVTKTLVTLRGTEYLSPGADVQADGRPVGTVTSSSYSPTLAAPLALAVVKRSHNAIGTIVQVEGLEAQIHATPALEPAVSRHANQNER